MQWALHTHTQTHMQTHTQVIPQHSAAAVTMETAGSPSPQPYEKRAPTSGDSSLPHAHSLTKHADLGH